LRYETLIADYRETLNIKEIVFSAWLPTDATVRTDCWGTIMNGVTKYPRGIALSFAAILFALCLNGCANFKAGSFWIEGGNPNPAYLTFSSNLDRVLLNASPSTAQSDRLICALDHYRQAELLAVSKSARSVDEFYLSAVLAWKAFSQADYGSADAMGVSVSALDLYHQSLRRLLNEANQFGRLDGGNGIVVEESGKQRLIPFSHQGFKWQARDFQKLIVVGQYGSCSLSEKKTTEGIGIPVVIERAKNTKCSEEDYFLPDFASFPATVLLSEDGNSLQILNPLATENSEVVLCGKKYPLAHEKTADIAYGLHYRTDSSLQGFFRPTSSQEKGKLFFSEPLDAEKIPVVFVHGLFSSPNAWGNVFNELRSNPKLYQRYQFWFFRYPTGLPFTHSAAELRGELNKVLDTYGQTANPQNLQRAVFIGHSMGGLISKLMIAESGDNFWNAISNVPLDQLNASALVKDKLRERLFFEPHPMASRVVFIGTPHRGSAIAGRMLGRLASSTVQQSDDQYKEVLCNNPGAFKEAVMNGIPTSIDLLNPREPFLNVIDKIQLRSDIPLHTIFGNSCLSLSSGGSDGVVDAVSAKHRCVESELAIFTTHNGLLRSKETYQELTRILELHDQQDHSAKSDSWSKMLDWLRNR
jgi:pimeloyl-ACP methyl ester carboxylesterase